MSVWGVLIGLIALAAIVPTDNTNKPEENPQTNKPELTTRKPTSPEPSSVKRSDWKTLPVEFGTMSKYTYKRNLFNISIPEQWQEDDKSVADEVSVVWKDKTGNGAVIVKVFNNQDGEIDKEEMGDKLELIIKQIYTEGLEKVEIDKPKVSDKGATVAWRFINKDKSGNTPVSANSEIHLEKDKLAIYTVMFPTEQTDRVRDRFQEIQSSFTVNPDATVSESKN